MSLLLSDIYLAYPLLYKVNMIYKLDKFVIKINFKKVKVYYLLVLYPFIANSYIQMFIILFYNKKDNKFIRFINKYTDL